ncbi:homocitrate synthase [Podospora fimiseda]|uniref:Homocitrate synthase n=1 Tax=Podospora fimiseda TaxID=252190 RepID=A0AAN7H0H5_9PEZI|nr:homocitrate synthase [Podospora fimiseda]
MPLHLLGKKSWNVYNADNIARVRRDEAAAKTKEEAEEQRMQEQDAARRLAILRGEVPPTLEPSAAATEDHLPSPHSSSGGVRKRKRAGEDDTDFEMRLAKERAEVGSRATKELRAPPSLIDSKGHITLFSEADIPQKNEEAERENERKKREYTDQYQMRMVNAAGKDGQGLTKERPWYASADGNALTTVPSKNVFGKDDPGRKVREATRLDSSDPLAMMKRGAAKVRELDKERKRENEERERELEALKREERRESKRRREERSYRREDGPRSKERHRSRSRGGGRYERRDRSRTRERERHRRRDWSRSREDRHDDRDKREQHREDNREKRHREDDRRQSKHDDTNHRSYKSDRDRYRE